MSPQEKPWLILEMVNKATVTSKTPALGVEFHPDQFADAVTPDVVIDNIDFCG